MNISVKNKLQHIWVVLIVLIILPTAARSQITPDSINASFDIYSRLKATENGSRIVIDQSPQIEALLRQHFNKGGSGKSLKGWRVRIYRNATQEGRSRAEGVMYGFRQKYPNITPYFTYSAPYSYVTVGDFRTRDEAEKLKKEVANIYPEASLVEATINFPPL